MVDSTPLIPDSSSKDDKQGHRVLGCCDSRRAVIVINSILLALVFLDLLLLGVSYEIKIWTIIVIIVNILFYIIVIYSAVQFQYVGVIVAMIWNVVDIVLYIAYLIRLSIFGNTVSAEATVEIVFSILLFLLAIYAECVYVSEVRKGIMSSETHSRETYSW